MRKKHQLVASRMHPDTGSNTIRPVVYAPMSRLGINQNLGTCPDQESNLQPFGYGMTLQPTEPYCKGSIYSYSRENSDQVWECRRKKSLSHCKLSHWAGIMDISVASSMQYSISMSRNREPTATGPRLLLSLIAILRLGGKGQK